MWAGADVGSVTVAAAAAAAKSTPGEKKKVPERFEQALKGSTFININSSSIKNFSSSKE